MANLPPSVFTLLGALFVVALLLLVWLGSRVSWRRTVVPTAVACPLAYLVICALGMQGPLMLAFTIANALASLIVLLIVEALLARLAPTLR